MGHRTRAVGSQPAQRAAAEAAPGPGWAAGGSAEARQPGAVARQPGAVARAPAGMGTGQAGPAAPMPAVDRREAESAREALAGSMRGVGWMPVRPEAGSMRAGPGLGSKRVVSASMARPVEPTTGYRSARPEVSRPRAAREARPDRLDGGSRGRAAGNSGWPNHRPVHRSAAPAQARLPPAARGRSLDPPDPRARASPPAPHRSDRWSGGPRPASPAARRSSDRVPRS